MAPELKRAILGIPHEVKQMRVAAAEFVLAVDAEGVIPDDPSCGRKRPSSRWKISLGLGGKIIADGQPERAGGL